jgi:Ni/Fe-hydrogenase subunit HybB-like protein
MREAIRAYYQYLKDNFGDIVRETGLSFYIFIIVLLTIMAWGFYSYMLMFVEGHWHSGMSDVVPWGIYISMVAFFIGASAGATMVGLIIYGFGRKDYKAMGTRAILLALLCIFAATQFLIVDFGNPFRAMKIPWLLRNPTSMFFISSSSYYGFMLILSMELYYTVKISLGIGRDRDRKMAKWLGLIAVPYALVVVHTFTGTIFGVIKAREMWNTPLLPVHFVVSALASGFAIVVFVAVITSWIRKKEILPRETFDHSGLLLAAFLVATIFIDFVDYVVLIYSDLPEGREVWHILSTRYAPLFVLNIGGMIAAALILFFRKGRSLKGLFIASTLTIIGILAYRINLIIVGQLVPLYPELGELYYVPTVPEIAVLLGLVALVTFLYVVLSKLIPMEDNVVNASIEAR